MNVSSVCTNDAFITNVIHISNQYNIYKIMHIM